MGQHAPWAARSHKVTKTIEQLAKRMLPLQGVFTHQRQIRCAKRPLLLAHIAGITASFLAHPKRIAAAVSKVQA